MGSQYIVDPKMAAVLRHALNPDQANIQYWVDNIAAVSLGTSTAKTKLGGTQVVGTGADYLLPTAARAIVAVRPKFYGVTPTASQAFTASLKVESADLKMGDFEVFANPLDSTLGTNMTQFEDAAPWYPLMQPCYGGEKVQVYGTAQIANTAAPYMAADLLLADTPPEGFVKGAWEQGFAPVQAKLGAVTATGTAAASIGKDSGVTLSTPKKRIIGLYTLISGAAPTASKPFGGYMTITAGELAVNPLRYTIEPITGFAGTTTAATLTHISAMAPLNMSVRAPTNLVSSFALDLAVSAAGNFQQCYMYLDNP